MDPKSISAFPVPGWKDDADFNGMALRDYFAAKAMHQFLHCAVLPAGHDTPNVLLELARRAYEIADAMLASRA